MTHTIHGIELEFENNPDQMAYKDGELYSIMESTKPIIAANCLGRVSLVMDGSKIIYEKLPMMSYNGYTIYSQNELYALRSAINRWDESW